MKKAVKSILFGQLQKSAFFKNRIFSIAFRLLKNNNNDFEYFLKQFNAEVKDEIDKFPSVFNDGYKHIDKVIEFARFFNLPPDDLIVDVGAASGDTPIRFTKAFPSSTIYSFEPIPHTFELLSNATAAYANIHCIHKALGNEIKPLNIHIASRITSSSLLNIEKNLTNEFWAKNLKEEGTLEVQMSKLDVEIPQNKNVTILKMDVQGYELEVLKGGAETLKRTALVLVEMQNHDLYIGSPKYYELDAYLLNNNFELYDMIPSIRQDKKLYEWDAIYVNNRVLI